MVQEMLLMTFWVKNIINMHRMLSYWLLLDVTECKGLDQSMSEAKTLRPIVFIDNTLVSIVAST